jgi:protein-disulfide isomerase
MANPSSPNSSNPWFAVSMGLVGVIVGYMLGTGSAALPAGVPAAPAAPTVPSAPEAAPPAKDVKPVDAKVDHIRGNPDAKISVIEYSDFECPFCSRNHPTMQQILDTYGDDVNWVYRHYPLPFHPNAQKAAEASECAASLGGNDTFWAMADMIMEKGADNTQLASYAKTIGLSEAKFTECLGSGKHAQRVQDDMSEGSSAGVNGTPGNIVLQNETKESRMVSGAQPFSAFQTVIDEMLK